MYNTKLIKWNLNSIHVVEFFFMFDEFISPIEFFRTQHAVMFRLFDMQFHVCHQVVFILKPSLTYATLILGCLPTLDSQMTLETRATHVKAITVWALVSRLASGCSHRLEYILSDFEVRRWHIK